MNVVDKRELYNGASDTLARAVEMVVTPIVFALIGAWIDRTVGTGPVVMIAMVSFAVVGLAVRSYFTYAEEMRRQEQDAPWALRSERS